jgi:hypothetical protein
MATGIESSTPASARWTPDVAIPKLRSGCYVTDWPLERRTQADAVLTWVVATRYLLEVRTPRLEKLASLWDHPVVEADHRPGTPVDRDVAAAALRPRTGPSQG